MPRAVVLTGVGRDRVGIVAELARVLYELGCNLLDSSMTLLRGEFASEAEMVERLKYAIHDFTRRQLTWFRKDPRITWLEGVDIERAEKDVRTFLAGT